MDNDSARGDATAAGDDRARIGRVEPPSLHVMTFNVRRPVPWAVSARDRWRHRRGALARIVAMERPSLLAAQEVTPPADAVLRAALGPGYVRVGTGRGRGGDGEMNPLYVDGSRLTVTGEDQFALSPTPEVAGSRGWGSALPRTAVVARLRDRMTGVEFTAVGTHLDHLSARSRRHSAELLRAAVRGWGEPAVVMGDLNEGPGAPALSALGSGGALRDAWGLAREHLSPEWGSRPGYRPPSVSTPRIDHILVTAGVEVQRMLVNDHRHGGRWASDHLPVHAVLRFSEGGTAS